MNVTRALTSLGAAAALSVALAGASWAQSAAERAVEAAKQYSSQNAQRVHCIIALLRSR